jgi:osmotically-inducible protein OsmY
LDPYLGPYPIQVAARNGVVRLQGQVANAVEKDVAQSLAAAVPGVQEVVNALQVTPSPSADEGRAQAEQALRDATIAGRVKMRLYWHRDTHNIDADVEAEEGTVRLTGHVKSTAESDMAGMVARRTDGVEGVRNHLLVMIPKGASDEEYALPPESPGPFPDLTEQIDDEWITRVVSTGIAFIRGIDPVDIDVNTKDRVVTLTGTVMDPEDSVRAADFARAVIGVEEVRNQIIVKTP